ncbi:MAG: hypothetical protein VW552_05185, partial [Ilumatobacter sp.]
MPYTDDETPQQRVVGLTDECRAIGHQRSHPVRGARQRPTRGDISEPIDAEGADHVLPGHPTGPIRVEWLALSGDDHPLPRVKCRHTP